MKKNYRQIITTFKCLAPKEEDCSGYVHGSHGNCYYRGTGRDYETCHNPKDPKIKREYVKSGSGSDYEACHNPLTLKSKKEYIGNSNADCDRHGRSLYDRGGDRAHDHEKRGRQP